MKNDKEEIVNKKTGNYAKGAPWQNRGRGWGEWSGRSSCSFIISSTQPPLNNLAPLLSLSLFTIQRRRRWEPTNAILFMPKLLVVSIVDHSDQKFDYGIFLFPFLFNLIQDSFPKTLILCFFPHILKSGYKINFHSAHCYANLDFLLLFYFWDRKSVV